MFGFVFHAAFSATLPNMFSDILAQDVGIERDIYYNSRHPRTLMVEVLAL